MSFSARFSLTTTVVISLLASAGFAGEGNGPFRRIASFPVFQNTDVDLETVAEIVAASEDGNLLIYTDSETENLGFIDITDPANPIADGLVALGGEPTSVAVAGDYALASINTSADFVNTSGDLLVIDIASRQIVATLPLGGQPDAVAVSPDGQYAAIAIENERDEDLGDGEPPQLPAGFLAIVDLVGAPSEWSVRTTELVGIPTLFPEDPEPEFVDINAANVAVVTLQENNHIVLVYLPTGEVLVDFEAGTVDLELIDTIEDDLINQDSSLTAVPREADAVTWTSPFSFATADEGDLFGGSRGFTIYTPFGPTLYESGNDLEHGVARIGHYPEGRSENKGCEPEGIEYGSYDEANYLFVGSERSNVVFVYKVTSPFVDPELLQVLPTGVGPEGLLAIPERDLFVVACEKDDRGDKIRATVMIYSLTDDDEGDDDDEKEFSYPSIVSTDRDNGTPIPWAALSGLAQDPEGDEDTVFAVYDSFYRESRFFTIDISESPAVITDELALNDGNGLYLAALNDLKAQLPGTDDFDPASLINDNGTVNLDPEGVAIGRIGTRFIASEGRGNLVDGVSDPDDRPFEFPNSIVRFDDTGTIIDVILPPLEMTRNQLRFGLEGITAAGNDLFVCFQREWSSAGDPDGLVRIGRFNLVSREWSFAHYPLDTATSPAGGWVGLSEISFLGNRRFAVIERDNQGGPDASVKRIYSFSVSGVDFRPASEADSFEVLQKELELDLIAEGSYDYMGGLVPEKLEGMVVLPDGDALIVNDNDGVDDNSGETVLLRVEDLF